MLASLPPQQHRGGSGEQGAGASAALPAGRRLALLPLRRPAGRRGQGGKEGRRPLLQKGISAAQGGRHCWCKDLFFFLVKVTPQWRAAGAEIKNLPWWEHRAITGSLFLLNLE